MSDFFGDDGFQLDDLGNILGLGTDLAGEFVEMFDGEPSYEYDMTTTGDSPVYIIDDEQETDYLPWLIGGGVIIVAVILYFALRKK